MDRKKHLKYRKGAQKINKLFYFILYYFSPQNTATSLSVIIDGFWINN
jgi:hypothetical protein